MAMEYFKEKIEPTLPEINYLTDFSDFSSSLSTSNFYYYLKNAILILNNALCSLFQQFLVYCRNT